MKNELRFSTKLNANGNSFKLLVDLENKTYQAGYFIFLASESDVNISKKEIGKAIKAISEKFELVDKALVSKIVKTYIKE